MITIILILELQKFGGAMFFAWDGEMKEGINGEAAKINTSDLNEELGQVR